MMKKACLRQSKRWQANGIFKQIVRESFVFPVDDHFPVGKGNSYCGKGTPYPYAQLWNFRAQGMERRTYGSVFPLLK